MYGNRMIGLFDPWRIDLGPEQGISGGAIPRHKSCETEIDTVEISTGTSGASSQGLKENLKISK